MAALAVAFFGIINGGARAGDPRYPFRGSNDFGTGVYAPSYYGYNLDEMNACYYGGGRYREYYGYGRGYGIANYPGPLPGPGLPPDYRGSMTSHRGHATTMPEPPPLLLPQGERVAQIHVNVPADAEVWIEGQATKQAGTKRWFVSPELTKGQQFEYKVRARWNEEGRPVEQTQQLTVKAGDHLNVTFPTPGKKEVLVPPKLFPLGDGEK